MNRLTLIVLAALWGTAFGPGLPPALGADPPASRDAADRHCLQGVGLLSSDDLLGAKAEFRQALRLEPDFVQSRFSLGTALYLSGESRARTTPTARSSASSRTWPMCAGTWERP